MLGSQSQTAVSAFGREIPESRLDRILEPDWSEQQEPASKAPDCQNSLHRGTEVRAIRLSYSFRSFDFEHHDDRSLKKTNH